MMILMIYDAVFTLRHCLHNRPTKGKPYPEPTSNLIEFTRKWA